MKDNKFFEVAGGLAVVLLTVGGGLEAISKIPDVGEAVKKITKKDEKKAEEES